MNASSLGFMLLGIWLIIAGVIPLAGISFSHAAVVLEVLMIASGLFILVGSRASARSWWS